MEHSYSVGITVGCLRVEKLSLDRLGQGNSYMNVDATHPMRRLKIWDTSTGEVLKILEGFLRARPGRMEPPSRTRICIELVADAKQDHEI